MNVSKALERLALFSGQRRLVVTDGNLTFNILKIKSLGPAGIGIVVPEHEGDSRVNRLVKEMEASPELPFAFLVDMDEGDATIAFREADGTVRVIEGSELDLHPDEDDDEAEA